MNKDFSINDIAELDIGYFFFKKGTGDSFNTPAFGINIYEHPTLNHFDPDHADLYIVNSEKELELLTVFHPWTRRKEYQLAPGLITISDRVEKKIEAFSFGGLLTIQSFPEKTSSLIISPAPILRLEPDNITTMAELLAEEMIKLLAVSKAEYLPKNKDFETRLASIPPLQLYIASLRSIMNIYGKIPDEKSPKISQFKKFIRHIFSDVKDEEQIQYKGKNFEDLL